MAGRNSTRLSRREGRKFGLTLGIAFGALGGLLWWRGHVTVAAVAAGLAAALILSGWLIPRRLDTPFRAWMALARGLSRVTTPIFMAIVFFLVLTPVGVVRRILGGNPLKPSGEADSFWREREGGGASRDMRRQF